MRSGRLAGCLLGACLLFGAERLFGQRPDAPSPSAAREVIATAVPVTNDTTPTPPPPGSIQQVSFVPDAPPNAPVEARPAPPAPPPSAAAPPPSPPMLPPSALLGTMRTSNPTAPPAVTKPMQATAAALSVEVVGANRVLLGKPLAYEIVLRNSGGRPFAELHVEQPLPPGARVVKTDPQALVKDNRLVWDLRHLEAGAERRLKIELRPDRAGELDLRPYVTFLCGDGLRTQVTRPPFSIEMSADTDKAPRGGRIRFTIVVANFGDVPIENIHLYDQLPPGLHHPQGPKIATERFTLLVGETRTISLETTGVESGKFRNEVFAFADRGVETRAAADVVISEPSLSLRVEGPTRTLSGREVEFHVEASNPGSLTAKNVRLVQALPPTLDVVSAGDGAALDNRQHALVWSLADLSAGQRQKVTFRVKASRGGDWPMTAAVLSQNLPDTRVSQTLHVEAVAALKIEVRAREERLAVGADTVFRVHVFNKGDAPCRNVRLSAVLPEALTPLQVEGGQVEKQQVRFAPLAQFDAHADVVYRIPVRGRQAGQGSLRVELSADQQTPVLSEISIQVHNPEDATTATKKPDAAKSVATETLR